MIPTRLRLKRPVTGPLVTNDDDDECLQSSLVACGDQHVMHCLQHLRQEHQCAQYLLVVAIMTCPSILLSQTLDVDTALPFLLVCMLFTLQC